MLASVWAWHGGQSAISRWRSKSEPPGRGVELVKEPAVNPPYRIYNAFVRDPNGYLMEIERIWGSLV